MSLLRSRIFYVLLVRRTCFTINNTKPSSTLQVCKPQVSCFSSTLIKMSSEGAPVAEFEEVQAVKDNPDVLLIDVREPAELKDTGSIPGSINIPLGELESALTDLSGGEFKKRFGREKPDKDLAIITSCKMGGRAAKAQEIAVRLGFKSVKSYAGSWMEWAEKNGL